MSKFSAVQQTNVQHPIATGAPTTNFAGGRGFELDAQSDLFLLACTNMVGESTFYESGSSRDERYERLIHEVTAKDADWVRRFAPFLRNEMGMRSASVVLACEYVKAGGENGRKVIDAVCQRADEPGEVLGYWYARHGRKIPQPVKRGVADAAQRLYNERNVLRYDGERRAIRFADVIELTHPKPSGPTQAALFRYLLDERHHGDGSTDELTELQADGAWMAAPGPIRRGLVRTESIPRHWSWERLAGWLPGGMDAEGWGFAIPNMGVMALLRNLRNFDEKGISEQAVDSVIAKITDAEEVKRSRIWPLNVWGAYREAPSDNWKRALGKTLDLTTPNTPELPGRTLILIDMSGSMQQTLAGRSTLQRIEVAAVMASAMFKRNDADLVVFGQNAAKLGVPAGTSALKLTQDIVSAIGMVGHSTMLHSAIRNTWDRTKHKRVIVFTDDQAQDAGYVNIDDVGPIYTFDLAGHGRASTPSGGRGRFRFGGFSDKLLAAIPVLESGHDGSWPF